MDLFQEMKAGDLGYGEMQLRNLEKALTAVIATDSAAMTGNRTLIPQDIENTLVRTLTFKRQDFRLLVSDNYISQTKRQPT